MPLGRGLYICFLSESNSPNLLDEPLNGFIVTPAYSPWKYFGSYKPRNMGIMTHSESVQSLQSVKLVYQPCSLTRAAWILFEIDGSMDGLGDD